MQIYDMWLPNGQSWGWQDTVRALPFRGICQCAQFQPPIGVSQSTGGIRMSISDIIRPTYQVRVYMLPDMAS